MTLKDHYFATDLDGLPERRFSTLPAAMTAVLGYKNPHGHVVYKLSEEADPVPVMKVNADGSWKAIVYQRVTETDEDGL